MSNKRSGDRLQPGDDRSKTKVPEAPLSPDVALVRIVAVFVAVVALFEIAGWFLTRAGYFDPVCKATASITGALSNLTGVTATVSGIDIFLAARTLRIDVDCTGVSLLMVYAALVIAYPMNLKRKAIGLAIGIPVILIANLARLVAVAQLAGPLGDRAFFFTHDYLFQVIMLGVVILLWGLYLSLARMHAT